MDTRCVAGAGAGSGRPDVAPLLLCVKIEHNGDEQGEVFTCERKEQ